MGEDRGGSAALLLLLAAAAAGVGAWWYFIKRKECPEGQTFDDATGQCVPAVPGGGGGGGTGLTVRAMLIAAGPAGVGERFPAGDRDMYLERTTICVNILNYTATPVRVTYLGLDGSALGSRVLQSGETVRECGIKRVTDARPDSSASASGLLPVVCEGVDWNGECAQVGEGDYPNLSAFAGRNWNDKISSIYLPPVAADGSRYEVTLWENAFYGGRLLANIVSDRDLRPWTFGGVASSMKVRKLLPPATCASQGGSCNSPALCVDTGGRCIAGTGCDNSSQCCCKR